MFTGQTFHSGLLTEMHPMVIRSIADLPRTGTGFNDAQRDELSRNVSLRCLKTSFQVRQWIMF